MILTCPNCATRYFLPDEQVGRTGRTVKCTSCASTWRAEPAAEEPLALQESPPEPEPPLRIDSDTLAGLPADRLSQTFRARALEQRKVREAAATGAIWAGLATALVLMFALAAVFRVSVVRLWPKTASAYAAVGLAVNPTGLIIEQVKAAPGAAGGHPAVMVSGVVRNVADRSVSAPPLRVSLLSKDGRSVARQLADAPAPDPIQPGDTRRFAVALVNPPQTASDVEVTFALDAVPAHPTPPPKLRGPLVGPPPAANAAPAPGPTAGAPPTSPGKPPSPAMLSAAPEARPLPAGSPYALSPHASVE
ncbi:MAG TPA: DUF3426 domain-containing protein [Caulobacteraceae bacterium]|nr:DUF3426 domain-containing protein [Caulobacteraceae bacterium]